MSDQIPDDVAAFIGESISSIAELELLLLLAEDGSRSWPIEAIARQLYVAPAAAEDVVLRMASRGLLDHTAEGYLFAPKTPGLAATVRALRDEFAKRRVRVIELIYAGPTEKYQSFANAFRLRKNPKSES